MMNEALILTSRDELFHDLIPFMAVFNGLEGPVTPGIVDPFYKRGWQTKWRQRPWCRSGSPLETASRAGPAVLKKKETWPL
jgi:hypothetical protein